MFISSFTAKLCNWLFFKLHLMLHACIQKFDVMGNLEIFWELNMAYINKVAKIGNNTNS